MSCIYERATAWFWRVLLCPCCVPFARTQDVSRLSDICRQSIIFDTADGVARCLRAINSDAEARLVRVKNRLDPDYESDASAGYRDVPVNLRLDTHHSRDLGLDSHVCELQLLLRPFAELKVVNLLHTPNNHAGYNGTFLKQPVMF